MSKLDDMFDELDIQNGKRRPDTAEEVRNQLRPHIKTLMLDIIGDMEQRETEDMSLKSWSNDDYRAFGRNEFRGELIKKVNDL